MQEMFRFDVSVTCATAGIPSRTCKMEVIAKHWADAAMTGVSRMGQADRVCVVITKQSKKETAA
jgi:hypothetical protein